MSVIRFFSNNGVHSKNPHEATDYVHSNFCALSSQQKCKKTKLVHALENAKQSGKAVLATTIQHELDMIVPCLRFPLPQALTNNRTTVEYAIKHTPHKYKYSSGVIAFAPDDTNKLNADFSIESGYRAFIEKLVFSGLPKSDQLIEWVRHSHAGNIENHFIIPRLNLRTGKYFNPHYPSAEKDFILVRDYMDLLYKLQSPTDPNRVAKFGHISPYDKNIELKKSIYKDIASHLKIGSLTDRKSIIRWLNDDESKETYSILDIVEKQDHIRLFIKGKTKAVRIYGSLFSATSSQQLQEKLELYEQEPTEIEQKKQLAWLYSKLEERIAARAEFNCKRYSTVTATHYAKPINSLIFNILRSNQRRLINKQNTNNRNLTDELIEQIINLLKKILNILIGQTGYDSFRTEIVQFIENYANNDGTTTDCIQNRAASHNSVLPSGAERSAISNTNISHRDTARSSSIENALGAISSSFREQIEFEHELIEALDKADSASREISERNRHITTLADTAFAGITNNFLSAMQRVSMYKNIHKQSTQNKQTSHSINSVSFSLEPER
jgi:hypothetical protein